MKWTFYCKEIVERRNKRMFFFCDKTNVCFVWSIWTLKEDELTKIKRATIFQTKLSCLLQRIFIFGTFSKQTLVYNLLEQWKSFLINKEKSEKYDKCFSSKTGPTVCQRIHHSDEKWEIANQERKVLTSHTLQNSNFTFLINCWRKKNSSLSFRMRCNLSCL